MAEEKRARLKKKWRQLFGRHKQQQEQEEEHETDKTHEAEHEAEKAVSGVERLMPASTASTTGASGVGYVDLGRLLSDPSELTDILNVAYLEQMRRKTVATASSAPDLLDETPTPSQHSQQQSQSHTQQSHSSPPPQQQQSRYSMATMLPFQLPLPSAANLVPNVPRHLAGSEEVSDVQSVWAPPESWIVSPVQHHFNSPTSKNTSAKPSAPDMISQIRVFRRQGNFSTVSTSINTTAAELCAILARKFFVQGDNAQKWELWVIRKNLERMIQPYEKPLRLQHQWLAEIGFDPKVDKFNEVGREDNSFLFRWVYSDRGSFTLGTPRSNKERFLKLIKSADGALTTDVDLSLTEEIDLTGCNLDAIPIVLFKSARNIKRLDISRNLMIDLPIDFAQMCSSLTVLKLSQVQMTKIPRAISTVSTLEVLDLSNNHIVTLAESYLQFLTNLKELNLRNNRLSGRQCIPADVVRPLAHLRKLDLSGNWLRGELPRGVVMVGMFNMTTVSPQQNSPRNRHTMWFTSPPTIGAAEMEEQPGSLSVSPLLELDLSYNFLTSLPVDFGDRLAKLKKLWLVANELIQLPDSLRTGMPDLEILDVRGNAVGGRIQMEAINAATNSAPDAKPVPMSNSNSRRNLKKLLLDYNQLDGIEISQKLQCLRTISSYQNSLLIQINFTTDLPYLTTLIISHSKLPFLADNFFSYTPNLAVLILNHNQITNLTQSIGCLKNLLHLECAHNNLASLPKEIRELRSLQMLDVHGNNINDLPAEIWLLPKLKHLNVSSNILESMPHLPGRFANIPLSMIEPATLTTSPSINPHQLGFLDEKLPDDLSKMSFADHAEMQLIPPLARTLETLAIADNRLDVSFFEGPFSIFCALKSLNVSHNDIFEVPPGAFRSFAVTLKELYLSGNQLTQLPEDIDACINLRRLFVNGNKLVSLPAELGRLTKLKVLDASGNQLRYNIGNSTYDWGWSSNPELKYLNLSGNKRLEIKPSLKKETNVSTAVATMKRRNEKEDSSMQVNDLAGASSELTAMKDLKVLSLMNTLLLAPVPDEAPNRRVRVSTSGGASMEWRKQVTGDSVLAVELASATTTTTAVSSAPTSTTVSPGSPLQDSGDPFTMQMNHVGLNMSSIISYGIADTLGTHEKTGAWDIVVTGLKFLKAAREEVSKSDAVPALEPKSRKSKGGECVFGLFEGNGKAGRWCSKWLSDRIVERLGTEMKKVFREQKRAGTLSTNTNSNNEAVENGGDVSEVSLIQHTLRRTFVSLNRDIGLKANAAAAAAKSEPKEEKKLLDTPDTPKSVRRGSILSPALEREFSMSRRRGRSNSISDGSKRKSGDTASSADVTMSSLIHPIPEDASVIDVRDSGDIAPQIKVALLGDEEEGSDDETSESDICSDDYATLMDSGSVGLIAFLTESHLFMANCGDCVAVLSRSGLAVPLSNRHTIFTAGNVITKNSPPKDTPTENQNDLRTTTIEIPEQNSTERLSAREEILRIRQTGGHLTRDGLIAGKIMHSRSFGHFNLLPHVNNAPYISITELSEQDEFVILASPGFWNTMSYQTAVDVARLKADDPLAAATMLRDFAMSYSLPMVAADEEEGEDPEACAKKLKLLHTKAAEGKLVNSDDNGETSKIIHGRRKKDAMTVMVVSMKDWILGRSKKSYTKQKRKKHDIIDSTLARLQPEVEPPTGEVTIVFTDVRNSTQLWERKPVAMRVAIKEHNLIMRRNLRLFNGYEVKTEGDAFMVSFQNVIDALRWCMTVQLQLLEAEWPQELLDLPDGKEVYGANDSRHSLRPDTLLYRGLSVRMGIHVGHPVCELDPVTRRMDYFGPMVNKTARVAGHAEGGQILVSTDVENAFRRFEKGLTTGAAEQSSQNLTNEDIKARTFSTSERVANIKTLAPKFISIGERKLKGMNAEVLISVLPKGLIARQFVSPPPLEEDKQKPITEKPKRQLPRSLQEPSSENTSVASMPLEDDSLASSSDNESRNGEKQNMSASSILIGNDGSAELRAPIETPVTLPRRRPPSTLRDVAIRRSFRASTASASINIFEEFTARLYRLSLRILNERICPETNSRELLSLRDPIIQNSLSNAKITRAVVENEMEDFVRNIEQSVDLIRAVYFAEDAVSPETKELVKMLLLIMSRKTL